MTRSPTCAHRAALSVAARRATGYLALPAMLLTTLLQIGLPIADAQSPTKPQPTPPQPVAPGQPAAPLELTPDDVGALNNRPVSRAEFVEYLSDRYVDHPAGQSLIADLRDRELIKVAITRHGITITEAEVADSFSELADRVKKETGGKQDLNGYLKSKGTSVEEFKQYLRRLVAARKILRIERKLDPTASVSDADVTQWLQGQVKNTDVVTDRTALPTGAVLRVEGRTFSAVEFGSEILKGMPLVERARELDRLLKHRLVERQLAQRSLALTEADIDAAIALDRARYANDPQTKGVAYEQILKQMGTSVAQRKNDANFRSSVAVFKIARALFSKEDLESYFNAHPARFGERRDVRHILLRVQDPRRPFAGGITDEQAQKKIAEITKRLEAGEAFDKIARTTSDDRSKFQGGYVGRIHREGRMDPVFAAAAFSLASGEVSKPVKTSFGYHLIKVDAIHPVPPFATVQEKILRARAKEWFASLVKSATLKNRYLDELREAKKAQQTAKGSAPKKPAAAGANGKK